MDTYGELLYSLVPELAPLHFLILTLLEKGEKMTSSWTRPDIFNILNERYNGDRDQI